MLASAVPPVAAHQQGVSYSDVRVADGRVRWDLTMSEHDLRVADADRDGVASAAEIVAAFPALRALFGRTLRVESGGERCPLDLVDFEPRPGGALFRLRGRCSGAAPLRLGFGLLAVAGIDGYNLAAVRWEGGFEEHVFTPRAGELMLAEPARRFGLGHFVRLGIEHIVTGWDHLLFLAALLVGGGGLGALVRIVTAFTIAHSVTLALATLDVVRLPERPVEIAIALSIAWVAVENLWRARPASRWRITFCFGLVHGFGFATVLGGLALPRGELLRALLGFNLGVELGQLVAVAAAVPLLAVVERSRWRRPVVVTVSLVILACALRWLVERALA